MSNEKFQRWFDQAYIGLRSQGFLRSVSISDPSQCQYRGAEGRKCAVGWLIPDEAYQGETSVLTKAAQRIPDFYLSEDADWQFLRKLQAAHDQAYSNEGITLHDMPKLMQIKLASLAEEYGLTIPA